MTGWVRCFSFAKSGQVGDLGALYAADDTGAIVRIKPVPPHKVPGARWAACVKWLLSRHVMACKSCSVNAFGDDFLVDKSKALASASLLRQALPHS